MGALVFIFLHITRYALTYPVICSIIKTVKKVNTLTSIGQAEKGENMSEEMNASELLKQVSEENQTRKILEILNESKDLAEAKEKVKALLNK